MKPKFKFYRVYLSQVNQTYVEVKARDEREAREKGYRKWRRDEVNTSVCSVIPINHFTT